MIKTEPPQVKYTKRLIPAHCCLRCYHKLLDQLKYVCLFFRHWLTNAYACFGMPYFYYDIFAMYRADKHLYCRDSEKKRENNTTIFSKFIRDNKMMMLHHSIMPLIIFPVIVVSLNV